MSKFLRFFLIAVNVVVLLWAIQGFVGLATRQFPQSRQSPAEWQQHVEQVTSPEELRQMSIKDDEYIRALEKVGSGAQTRMVALTALLSLYALACLLRLFWKRSHETAA
jgi:hypothetical protein